MNEVQEPTNQSLAMAHERYELLVMERYHAMVAGRPYSSLRLQWLAKLKRITPFASMDKWETRRRQLESEKPEQYRALQIDVGSLSEAYGLAPWQVLWGVFVRDYNPRDPEARHSWVVLDSWHPQARVLVMATSQVVIDKLVRLSTQSQIYVEIDTSAGLEVDVPEKDLRRFRVVLDVPVELPPELATHAAKEALSTVRKMVRLAGVPVPERVRTKNWNGIRGVLATHSEHDVFIQALMNSGVEEGIDVLVEPDQPSVAPADGDGKTALSLVRLKLYFALDIQARALEKEVRDLVGRTRRALKSAGLDLGFRLRTSPTVERAAYLKVDGESLGRDELGDMVEQLHNITPREGGKPNPEGQKLKNKLKSSRNQVKKRLAKKGLLPKKD